MSEHHIDAELESAGKHTRQPIPLTSARASSSEEHELSGAVPVKRLLSPRGIGVFERLEKVGPGVAGSRRQPVRTIGG